MVLKAVFSTILLPGLLVFSGGCTKNNSPSDPDAGAFRFTDSIKVDGLERSYLINLPLDYYSGDNFSLVIALHGGGGSAAQFESSSLLTQKANAAGFVVVYPNGVKSDGVLKAQTWNAGTCCDYAAANNIDDVHFISQLINTLLSKYKINPRKVYATGHSNGGMMCYRLACELADKIAAIAVNACTLVTEQPCHPAHPVPLLHMHSVKDEHVPYLGGQGGGIGTVSLHLAPVDSVLNVFSSFSKCTNAAQVIISNNNYTFTKWSGCDNNVSIQFYLTQDGGHAWPGGLPGSGMADTPSTAINANDLLWDFFQQYQLPD